MELFHKYILEYKKLLQKGNLQKAYKGLMDFLKGFKLHLKNSYDDYFVSSSLQEGSMDFSYFFFFPNTLKKKKLKVAVLFTHETFSFEAWLAGYNKKVQQLYIEKLSQKKNKKYKVSSPNDQYSIIEHTLIAETDFSDMKKLTINLEKKLIQFIKDIEKIVE